MTTEMGQSVQQPASVKKKRRKKVSLDSRKARAGWMFILPFVLGFILIYLPMVIESIRFSFSDLTIESGSFNTTFVGFQNYRRAFLEDPKYAQILIKGLQKLAFDIPAIIIFSLFMAIMLNQKMMGRGVFRAIFFIPVILSTGIMESISSMDILSTYMEGGEGIDDGSGTSTATQLVSSMDLQRLFSNMKVGTEIVDYVTNAINNIYDIVNRSGVQMLIFLSGLQSISPAIYESCKIDGATAWETFWKITFPMITPMILVNAVYTVIDSFTSEKNTVMSYISGVYSQPDGRELSAAMSWIYFMIVIAIVGVVAAILSAFVFYQRKSE